MRQADRQGVPVDEITAAKRPLRYVAALRVHAWPFPTLIGAPALEASR
jgi:hypothetical protein